jgi:hypothetical protein
MPVTHAAKAMRLIANREQENNRAQIIILTPAQNNGYRILDEYAPGALIRQAVSLCAISRIDR